jgi:hypothetical protein
VKFIAAILLALASFQSAAQSYGSFIGEVIAKWNPDGRTMTLTAPFAYKDPTGYKWEAPTGSVVDGASIPKIAWSIIGGPFEGSYRDSSVIHDVGCDTKKQPWQLVHKAFYTGMLASGVNPIKAKTMYAAVYHFGPRWPEKKEIRQITSQTSETRQCIKMPIGDPVCIVLPPTPQVVERVMEIEIPPLPPTLSQDSFDRLKSQIESRETSLNPMSLEDIQAFQ